MFKNELNINLLDFLRKVKPYTKVEIYYEDEVSFFCIVSGMTPFISYRLCGVNEDIDDKEKNVLNKLCSEYVESFDVKENILRVFI